MKRRLVTIVASVTLASAAVAGCSRPSGNDRGTGPSASASAPSAAAASGTRSEKPSASPRTTAVRWAGTYTSAPGSLYVRDGGEWRGVRFRGDDASAGLGEGPLAMTVDSTTGRLSGTGSGPIGDVILSGTVLGDALAFNVVRKDPTDRGLSGTGVGRVNGESLAGTLRLSQGDARVIREATFSLAKKTP